jgi:hypothetical protein
MLVLVVLMTGQALSGLLLQGQYRDVAWIAAAWFGNDLVTLVVAVPLLSIGVARAARGSVRGVLVSLGTVAYAVYNYAFYMLGAALNAFFLLYVAAVVVSAVTLIVSLSGLDARAVAGRFRPATPVRLIGSGLVTIASGLASVWIGIWGAHVFAGRATPVEPDAFRLVAALDLSLMVPALAAGGILLWRRSARGYVVAAIAGVQATLYLLVLSVNSIVAIARGLTSAPGELPLWALLMILTLAMTLLLFHNVEEPRRRT